MKTFTVSREQVDGALRYYHWYDAYSYTDFDHNCMVFMPIPFNIIVAIGLWLKDRMFQLIHGMEKERNKIARQAFYRGYELGRSKAERASLTEELASHLRNK